MLVLSRKTQEALYIGPNIRVVLVSVGKGSARIGIEAPGETFILRAELGRPKGDEQPRRRLGDVSGD
jgi:carbon storage regulator